MQVSTALSQTPFSSFPDSFQKIPLCFVKAPEISIPHCSTLLLMLSLARFCCHAPSLELTVRYLRVRLQGFPLAQIHCARAFSPKNLINSHPSFLAVGRRSAVPGISPLAAYLARGNYWGSPAGTSR